MAVSPNIEVFNQVGALTFVRLYEAFPSPTHLDPALIGVDIVLRENYEPEGTHYKSLVDSTEDAIQYLIDEGFIRVVPGAGNLSLRGFPGAVLTSKGFGLLQSMPSAVDATVDRRTPFERLKSMTAAGMKAAAPETVAAVIGRLLAGI